jgi:hypothetical protein
MPIRHERDIAEIQQSTWLGLHRALAELVNQTFQFDRRKPFVVLLDTNTQK